MPITTDKSYAELREMHLTSKYMSGGRTLVVCLRCGGLVESDSVEHPLADCVAELSQAVKELKQTLESHNL